MRGFQLKDSKENSLESSTSFSASIDETTPIIPNKKRSIDHGSITMERTLSANDIYQNSCKNYSCESNDTKAEEAPERMSLLRKVCFVLSFNGGILYVVAFAWLIPCRFAPCLYTEDTWTLNRTNSHLTTNLITNARYNPTLIIFGQMTEGVGKLNSLTIANGTETWNNTLQDEPLQVFCSWKEECKLCFATGQNFIAAVYPENGTILWDRTISTDDSISKIFLTQKENETYLIGITNSKLKVFSPDGGQKVATASLPCSWTVDVKIVGPWSFQAGFIWGLICQNEDGIEAFVFKEQDLLHFPKNENKTKSINVNFKSIFRRQSYSGSIDLACDVTTTLDSLVLSWANMVTMVTAQAPFQHFHETWERSFSSPFGYAVEVTSITTGYFYGPQSIQIAVAVNEGPNSTIHILESRNGSSIAESLFFNRTIVSIKRLSGAEGERDALLVESIKNDGSSNETSESESRSFHMFEYEGKKSALRFITISQGYYTSSLSLMSRGSSNLIVVSSDSSGNVILDRFIVENKDPDKSWCRDDPQSNPRVMWLLE